MSDAASRNRNICFDKYNTIPAENFQSDNKKTAGPCGPAVKII